MGCPGSGKPGNCKASGASNATHIGLPDIRFIITVQGRTTHTPSPIRPARNLISSNELSGVSRRVEGYSHQYLSRLRPCLPTGTAAARYGGKALPGPSPRQPLSTLRYMRPGTYSIVARDKESGDLGVAVPVTLVLRRIRRPLGLGRLGGCRDAILRRAGVWATCPGPAERRSLAFRGTDATTCRRRTPPLAPGRPR